MRIFLVIIILGVNLSFSCCNTSVETTYSYKGAVIKRIDRCGKTVFYYNNIGKHSIQIRAEYSGINDGFAGYLVFDDSGKVSLLSGDGFFKFVNIDTSKFEYKRILAYQRPEMKKNVYYIELSTKYEKEENLNRGTEVNVKYHNDVN